MEVHVLDGKNAYDSWKLHAATGIGEMDRTRWKFTFGDFNGDRVAGDADADGRDDLFMLDAHATAV